MIRGGYWGGAWGLSWAGAWGEAWLLLNQPYQELDLKGQVFVRSYLSSIHSAEVAEQIVAVAALNNISVIDAEVLSTGRKTRVAFGSPEPDAELPSAKEPKELTCVSRHDRLYETARSLSISAASEQGGFSVKSFMSK